MKRIKKQRPAIHTVAIVGDGFVEQIYFQQMTKAENIRQVQIKPELPNRSGKGGNFQRVMEKAKDLKTKEGYDQVFCLVDMDVVNRENNHVTYQNEKTRLLNLRIEVIECNPCFEIWILLHFQQTSKIFESCQNVEQVIRKSTDFTDYSKERKVLEKKNLYKFLHPRLHTTAIPNSKWLEGQQQLGQSNYFPRCEVFKVIENFSLFLP